jgi:catechol 2,3-dioxygenase-like lactoylglutathione lyase family enzyme
MASAEIKLTKIGVIMLGVTDLARSVAFYRDKLGITVKQQVEAFVFLDGGGVMLVLTPSLTKATGRAAGATEIVFSVDDVRAAYEALRARGITFTQEPRVVSGPMWAANFEDPDGHMLSIFGPERRP